MTHSNNPHPSTGQVAEAEGWTRTQINTARVQVGGYAKLLENPDWTPRRAHIEGTRNLIKNLLAIIAAPPPAAEREPTRKHTEWAWDIIVAYFGYVPARLLEFIARKIAERERGQEERIERLEKSLRSSSCPVPGKEAAIAFDAGDAEALLVSYCVDHGYCGCDNAIALTPPTATEKDGGKL